MKKPFKIFGVLTGLGILVIAILFALLPWMDRWGATGEEITASLPGDELVPSPRLLYTRSVSINAKPEQIYPWIAQLGADKGGMYSYTWIESYVLQCPQKNADRIHAEWQGLKPGDKVLMCPNDMPPAFEVALIDQDRAIVLGHQDNGIWSDVWQFILIPQQDGTTHLVLRSRDAKEGWMWDLIRPGEFIMVRGMLLGIKERSESSEPFTPASNQQSVSVIEFERTISLAYPSDLASTFETERIPAVPMSDQIMFAESHPAYAQIRFDGFNHGMKFDLPIYAEDRVAQVMIFQTKDFPGYGDDSPQGFVSQSRLLADLLQTGVSEGHCTLPLLDYESALPFLPWTNAKQSFCAQPQMIEFAGGQGIRYLTHYAQDPSPVLEGNVFYTFQGLTDDGQFHVSAFFPVQTGIFPIESTACQNCNDPNYDPVTEWMTTLTEQLSLLNTKPGEEFSPSLQILDELIGSMEISQEITQR